jgi:Tfp pilus assembly protein PilV
MIVNRLLRLWAQPRRGYNLLDALIGMVVLAIGLSSAFAMSVANARLVEKNQNLAAANLAEYKIEELRNANFDSPWTAATVPRSTARAGDPNGFTRLTVPTVRRAWRPLT